MTETRNNHRDDETPNQRRKRIISRVTWVGIAVNIALSLAQIASGVLAHSQALIADGLHTLADLISDFVVLVTAHHASKEADEDHPYGHGRIETLISIFLGLALIAVAAGMAWRGYQAIISGAGYQTQAYAIFFALLAIVSKEFLYRYTMVAARQIKSTLLESNAMHHRSDVFSSVVVVVGVTAQVIGYQYMDALAAIAVSVMIAFMGVHLIRKAFAELIDTSLDPQLIEQIRQEILSMDGVVAVHRLRSRSMGGLGYIDTEIRVNPHLSVSEAHYISLSIEYRIRQKFEDIIDIHVHVDPVEAEDHEDILALPDRAEILFNLYSAWENLADADQIRNIHLHYLTRKIEIDLILPLEVGCEHHPLPDQLRERIRHIPYIGQLNIYYEP